MVGYTERHSKGKLTEWKETVGDKDGVAKDKAKLDIIVLFHHASDFKSFLTSHHRW